MTPHDRVEIPRRKTVTICIAAGCREKGRPVVVLCADTKGSSPLGATNVMQKVLPLTHGWYLGVAGDADEINGMFRVARDVFLKAIDPDHGGLPDIDDHNAEILFRTAIAQRIKDKKDEFVRAEVSMSFDELNGGKGKNLHPSHYDDILTRARAIKLRGQFLVAGVSYGAPFIVAADPDGTTSVHGDFVVLGSGTYLAQSMLLLRDHSDTENLARTVFAVYEAKRHAERESGVGAETRMYILSEEGLAPLSENGAKWVRAQYEQYQPKPLPDDMSAPADLLARAQIITNRTDTR